MKTPAYAFGPNRFYAEIFQRFQQVGDNFLPIHDKRGSKATPKTPTGPFQNTLTSHVIVPTIRTMEAVAIAFDGKAIIQMAFHDQINAKRMGTTGITAELNLWNDPVAPIGQKIVNLPFEV